MSIIEHLILVTFFGEKRTFEWKKWNWLRWNILVGKQKHKVQKPCPSLQVTYNWHLSSIDNHVQISRAAHWTGDNASNAT